MKLLIAFFLQYLLAPLLVILMLFVMNSIKGIKKTLSLKNTSIYIFLAGIVLGTPGFLAVLKDEYVWGGLLISIGLYCVYGLIFSRTISGSLGEWIGVKESRLGQMLVMLISGILGSWIHYLVFEWQGGMPYVHWVIGNILWYTIPYLISFSLDAYNKIPPPIYDLWNPQYSGYQRSYWENLDHFKAKMVVVKIKRRVVDASYTSLSVRLPNDIPLGDWFEWFLQDQSKRTPHAPIEVSQSGGAGRETGWLFYTSRWINYPLFIRVLDPKLTGEENKIRKGQVIYAKRVEQKIEVQNEKDEVSAN